MTGGETDLSELKTPTVCLSVQRKRDSWVQTIGRFEIFPFVKTMEKRYNNDKGYNGHYYYDKECHNGIVANLEG